MCLQAKVRGRGTGLQSRLYVGSVDDHSSVEVVNAAIQTYLAYLYSCYRSAFAIKAKYTDFYAVFKKCNNV